MDKTVMQLIGEAVKAGGAVTFKNTKPDYLQGDSIVICVTKGDKTLVRMLSWLEINHCKFDIVAFELDDLIEKVIR